MADEKETLIRALRNIPFLRDLAEDDIRIIADRMSRISVSAGTIFFQAEDMAEALYVVAAGEVEMLSAQGAPLAVLGPGSFMGELSLLAHRPYGVTARALTDVSLWELRRDVLEGLMEDHPNIAMAITRALVRRARPHVPTPTLAALSRMPLFEGLSESALQDIANHLQVVQYEPNAVIYEPGEPATALYLVAEGEVSVRRVEGNTAVELYRARANDFFGEEEALAGDARANAAVALTPTTCWVLPAADLDALVNRHPRLGLNMARLTAARLVTEHPVGPAQTAQFQAPVLVRKARPRRRHWPSPLGWLRRLDRGTRWRLAALTALVLWLVAVALPWTAWQTVQESQMYAQSNPADLSKTVIGNSPAGVSLATDLELAYPTPTYTPVPTATPVPTQP